MVNGAPVENERFFDSAELALQILAAVLAENASSRHGYGERDHQEKIDEHLGVPPRKHNIPLWPLLLEKEPRG
jgi:hypothetical protein